MAYDEHYAERKQQLIDNGWIVYSASSLGSCIKAQAALRLGYERLGSIPEKILNAMNAGTEREEGIYIHFLENRSVSIYASQQEILLSALVRDKKVCILGHIDGLEDTLLYKGMLVEIKTMGQAEWDKWQKTLWDTPGLVQRYKWQISVYMLALGTPCHVIIHNRDMDAEDDKSYYEQVLEVPFYSAEEVHARLQEIEDIVESGVLPIECSSQDFPCPVFYLHTDPTPPTDNPIVVELAGKYLELAAQEKQYADQKKKVRDSLLKELGSDPVKVEAGLGVTVSVYEWKRDGGFDEEKMKKDGIDVNKYKVEGKKGPAVRVTGPKGMGPSD